MVGNSIGNKYDWRPQPNSPPHRSGVSPSRLRWSQTFTWGFPR